MDKNMYFNNIFGKLAMESPKKIVCSIPSLLGEGEISQIATRQGCILSDWHMKYFEKTNLKGTNSNKYFQMVFCMKDGVSWDIKDKCMSIDCNESCIYRGNGDIENISYDKNYEYHFKSIKIPSKYFMNILSEYFSTYEKALIEKRICQGVSGIRTTNAMQTIFNNMLETYEYFESAGFLYLDSKVLQLLAEYIRALLEVDLCEKDKNISKDDVKAVCLVKNIIDSNIAIAPSCAELARMTGMSLSKFQKSFFNIIGMPVHSYIIDQRLEQAAKLLSSKQMNIGEVALAVGYSNMGHFSVAFKKKYGVSPKEYD